MEQRRSNNNRVHSMMNDDTPGRYGHDLSGWIVDDQTADKDR